MTLRRLDLFCRVVDNYGDIGICWRLARQLQQEHGLAVRLWVDDLVSFQRLCPQVATNAETQQIDAVTVRHWRDQDGVYSAADVADIVIEFFACDLPPGYIAAMAECVPRPVWFNLEGLTAEEWVEGCHRLTSPHPRLPLTKHFFFPGFTDKTGGLLREAALDGQRLAFQSDPAAMAAFLAGLGVAPATPAAQAATKVSLFCYPHAPVAALFDSWRLGGEPIACLVPEGVAAEAVGNFIGGPAVAGASATRDALTVQVLPFVPQPDYDKLLWVCDLNFVRGEDSFVRAQWAGKPFVWHIYPQDENLHHKKLRAFLGRYAVDLPALEQFSLRWNDAVASSPPGTAGGQGGQSGQGGHGDWPTLWRTFDGEMVQMAARAERWRQQMLANGDLAANLMGFAATLR